LKPGAPTAARYAGKVALRDAGYPKAGPAHAPRGQAWPRLLAQATRKPARPLRRQLPPRLWKPPPPQGEAATPPFRRFGARLPGSRPRAPPRRPSYGPWGPAWVPSPAGRALVYASGFRQKGACGGLEKTNSPPPKARRLASCGPLGGRGYPEARPEAGYPEAESGAGYPEPPSPYPPPRRPSSQVRERLPGSRAERLPAGAGSKAERGYPPPASPQPQGAPRGARPRPGGLTRNRPRPSRRPPSPSPSQVTRKPPGPRRTTNKSHHSSY
jgi:hypothetical protein